MNDQPLTNFIHIVENENKPRTIFLLHGTGADERDLLPLVSGLSDSYTFVGLRGNVTDQGMTRFFHRLPDGSFDEDNIRAEAKKLADFLTAWYDKHNLTTANVAFVGYSNGANMILALALLYPDLISKCVTLHCKLPLNLEGFDLSGKQFLVTFGDDDRMIPATESQAAITALRLAGAEVKVVSHPGGHEIDPNEIFELTKFLT